MDRDAAVEFAEMRVESMFRTDTKRGGVEVTKLVRLTTRKPVVLRTTCQKPRTSVRSSKERACDGRMMTCWQVDYSCAP